MVDYAWAESCEATANMEERMIQRLFVYGPLGPGRPNQHILLDIGGTFEPASVSGILHSEGWGAAMGYPAIELADGGETVSGFLFSSETLSAHWSRLDEFEGEAYKRVLTRVTLEDGSTTEAYIYELKQS